MRKVIYYFSGTGNSLRAANVIAERIGGAELISVRCNPEEASAQDAEVIGFVCPATDATPVLLIVRQKQFSLKRRKLIKSLAQSYPNYCAFPKSASVTIIR